MFSPLDDPQVKQWFQRLDAAWKRMPAEERARQREEVQQHLESLVAANTALGHSGEEAWTAALNQFGDPTQIGRKMYQEWRLGRTGFRADIAAILFGFGLQILSWFSCQPLLAMVFRRLIETHGVGIIGILIVVGSVISYGRLLLVNIAIGRKYPAQAIKGAFYGGVFWNLSYWILLIGIVCTDPRHYHPLTVSLMHSILWMPLWSVGQGIVAYFASVTKRGWYWPTWNDFKLTLPHRRQVSR